MYSADYVRYGDLSYKVYHTEAGYFSARDHCYSDGAQLSVLNSADKEDEFLTAMSDAGEKEVTRMST